MEPNMQPLNHLWDSYQVALLVGDDNIAAMYRELYESALLDACRDHEQD